MGFMTFEFISGSHIIELLVYNDFGIWFHDVYDRVYLIVCMLASHGIKSQSTCKLMVSEELLAMIWSEHYLCLPCGTSVLIP